MRAPFTTVPESCSCPPSLSTSNMEQRYEASMVLTAVGDSLGYRRSVSGFCRSGPKIHADIEKESASGVNGVIVAPPSWTLSDATVMNLATAEALVQAHASDDLTAVRSKPAGLCDSQLGRLSPSITCTR